MVYQKPASEHDTAYLGFIRMQPCVVCRDDVHVEAHHLRFRSLEHDNDPGLSQKANDRWALPLCNRHHVEAHKGEAEFWARHGIDPYQLCLKFQVMVR
jgi:hypothetical protein